MKKINNFLFITLQYLLPQHLLSNWMYRLARIRWFPIKNLLLKIFIWVYRIDLSEARESELAAYPHFNALFTRALRPEARPLDLNPNTLLSPVDGTISQIGQITDGQLLQIKGCYYGVRELLGIENHLVNPFEHGHFITIYLAPSDYHRIHMPLDGTLINTLHIPGKLFSVNHTTVANLAGIFTRNERLVCQFETELGLVALILVGAIFVGSIETVWAGAVTGRERGIKTNFNNQWSIKLTRGAEVSRFNLGSTIILLIPGEKIVWNPILAPGQRVKFGQSLANFN